MTVYAIEALEFVNTVCYFTRKHAIHNPSVHSDMRVHATKIRYKSLALFPHVKCIATHKCSRAYLYLQWNRCEVVQNKNVHARTCICN